MIAIVRRVIYIIYGSASVLELGRSCHAPQIAWKSHKQHRAHHARIIPIASKLQC